MKMLQHDRSLNAGFVFFFIMKTNKKTGKQNSFRQADDDFLNKGPQMCCVRQLKKANLDLPYNPFIVRVAENVFEMFQSGNDHI